MEKRKVNLISYRGHWGEKDPWQTRRITNDEKESGIPGWHGLSGIVYTPDAAVDASLSVLGLELRKLLPAAK